jgi:hypothetical protein
VQESVRLRELGGFGVPTERGAFVPSYRADKWVRGAVYDTSGAAKMTSMEEDSAMVSAPRNDALDAEIQEKRSWALKVSFFS